MMVVTNLANTDLVSNCAGRLARCDVTVLMAADVISCSLLKTAAERTYDRNQDASSDEASNQITDPTGEDDTEEAK